ncbi:Nn.00g013570.m01.CDS01 [Neocucurbitaria sp. VM-36]
MIYGPRRLSIDTVERWLIACVRKSLVYDTGNVLRESLDRMEAPDPILLDPPSNYEETNDDQGGVIFPEMSHALRNLRASEPQYEDCVEGTFRFFLKLAYAALDMYTFYRSHVNDPEPCECRLAYGASEYIKMLDYNPYSQLCFPTYLSWTLSNVNLRGSFDFLFKQILPSFYSILSTQPEYLGYKLYEWLLDAAKQSRSDWDDRIYDVILHAHRPDRLMMAERYNFRHRGADVEFPIAYFDRRRAAAEYLRNAGEFDNIAPQSPHFDLRQQRPTTSQTALSANFH